MIILSKEPYKIVYEGSYNGSCFELNKFDGDYEVLWLDFPPENVQKVEEEIFDLYYKQ